MKGHLQQRSPNSWRLKFDVGRDPGTGKRVIRYVTFRGTKRAAQVELADAAGGNLVEPSKLTLSEYLRSWVSIAEATAVSPKTAERYRQLIERQIIPHLGATLLQKLKPTNVAAWHATLLTKGRHDGSPLTARTVGHAHRVLHKALEDAVDRELVTKNVAGRVAPPKVDAEEVAILSGEQVAMVLAALAGSPIFAHVVVLISTGMRRGELMGLQWEDVDLEQGRVRVNRAVEVTKAQGLRIKPPKTRSGKRVIALLPTAVAVLTEHRRAQLEIRMKPGIGRFRANHHVFENFDGTNPDRITYYWRHLVTTKKLPSVTLHALRHSHASALIAYDHPLSIRAPVRQDRRGGGVRYRGRSETDREQILRDWVSSPLFARQTPRRIATPATKFN